VRFYRKEGTLLIRTCAPLDFGPTRFSDDDRYHFWDFDSETPHPLQLESHNIASIDAIDDAFDPEEFVSWDLEKFPWHEPRDWGRLS